jgi:hypothetical protein
MSYRLMLQHRCNVQRLVEGETNGYLTMAYTVVLMNVPCFLDLNFIRKGKDPMWTAEAGRPTDRTGVWFGLPKYDVRSGDQIIMVKGPSGTYQIEGAVDEAWRPRNLHHLELGVKEIGRPVAQGSP